MLTKAPLREAIHRHLLLHGPSTAEEIHRVLLEDGTTSAKTATGVRQSLAGSPLAFPLPDGRWDLTTRALAGVVLTVRPRSRIRHDTLWVHDDLGPFDSLLTGRRLPLTAGGTAELGGGQVRTLVGPPGWLPDVQPGGLIGLRWTGVALEVFAAEVAPEHRDVTDLRQLLKRHHVSLKTQYSYRETSLSAVLISALREDPEAFAQPRPPLSEIYPLSAEEVSDTSLWSAPEHAQRLVLEVPRRVHHELVRRAGLLGEPVAHHAAVLLGSAVDRVRLSVSDRWEPWHDYRDPDEPTGAAVYPLRGYR